jgi:formylmethanofuran dehydrogenase subunit E
MTDLEELFKKATAFHGQPCPDLALGIRMAKAGVRAAGVNEAEERNGMVVFVEIDRCIADAIQITTGCTAGGRNLKMMDYGKLAASFVNLKTDSAVRVRAKEGARERALRYTIGEGFLSPYEKFEGQSDPDIETLVRAYLEMPESALLEVSRVSIVVPLGDRPGGPVRGVPCNRCGEEVFDFKEILSGGYYACRGCATGRYYTLTKEGRRKVSTGSHRIQPVP